MDTTNKKIIPIEVRDEYMLGSGVSIGARGSYDSMVLKVKFDEKWLGLNKYATWTNAQGKDGDQTLFTALDLVDGETDTYYIPVPAFATEYAGTVKLSFSGYTLSGTAEEPVESLLNTVAGSFRVLESNAIRLDGGGITPTLAEQLTNTVNECVNRVVDAEGMIEEFEKKEAERQQEEDERQQEEDERIEAEKARDGNEVIRQSNERGRGENEGLRQALEDIRIANENKRISNETSREERFSEMEKLVGDLPEAVEAILALQESLIGGDEQ
jgi:hypothetical protein